MAEVGSPDYIVYQDSPTTVRAQGPSPSGSVFVGPEAGAALQAAINALAGSGGDILLDGLLTWGSVPTLPPNLANKLTIRGSSTHRITLTANGPRFLDFAKNADHDTFQNIELSDLVIDCNNIDLAGAQHTIIGNKQNVPVSDLRCNFSNIAIRRVRAFNVPATANARSGINIGTRQAAGGEGTQNFIKDIRLEEVWIDGGVSGIGITGGPAGAITNLNILIDNIRVIRCKHTQSSGTSPAVNGANIQIGQNAPVGYVLIRDFYGEYSKDVGIEIDNATEADVEDCVISNGHIGYLATNFAPAVRANEQRIDFTGCVATVTDPAVATATRGFSIVANNSVAIGNVFYRDCTFEHNNNVFGTTSNSSPIAWSLVGTMTVRQVSIKDCKTSFENINWNNASNTEPIRVIAHQSATVGLLSIRGLDVRGSGTISGAGLVLFRCIGFESGGSCNFRVDGIDIDWNITGLGVAALSYGAFIVAGSAATVGGSFRRIRFINLGSDTQSRGFRFGSTANLTISPAPITFEECDFSGIGSAGSEFVVDATQAALGAVVTRRNRWKTKPIPVGLTGLVTATGKILGSQSASVIWPTIVQCTQGSGAAITAIDYSTNAGTTYTNLVTQASAALPAGPGPWIGPLMPADLLKVTFTTTQPTVTLVPVDP